MRHVCLPLQQITSQWASYCTTESQFVFALCTSGKNHVHHLTSYEPQLSIVLMQLPLWRYLTFQHEKCLSLTRFHFSCSNLQQDDKNFQVLDVSATCLHYLSQDFVTCLERVGEKTLIFVVGTMCSWVWNLYVLSDKLLSLQSEETNFVLSKS